jgi:hypothetical protein
MGNAQGPGGDRGLFVLSLHDLFLLPPPTGFYPYPPPESTHTINEYKKGCVVNPKAKEFLSYLETINIAFAFISEVPDHIAMAEAEAVMQAAQTKKQSFFVWGQSKCESARSSNEYFVLPNEDIADKNGLKPNSQIPFRTVKKGNAGFSPKTIFVVHTRATRLVRTPLTNICWALTWTNAPGAVNPLDELLKMIEKVCSGKKFDPKDLARLPEFTPEGGPHTTSSTACPHCKFEPVPLVDDPYEATECKCRGPCRFFKKCGRYSTHQASPKKVLNVNPTRYSQNPKLYPEKVFFCGCVCGSCDARPCKSSCQYYRLV